MLQNLRDQTQGLGFKIIVAVLIFVLAVFGFGGFNLFANSGRDVASVNGVDITVEQLQRETQTEVRRIASQFGEGFDTSLLDPNQVQLYFNAVKLVENGLSLGEKAENKASEILRQPSFSITNDLGEGTAEESVYTCDLSIDYIKINADYRS